MKYYIVEPTYKKSFIEYTAFSRVGVDGERLHLTKELGGDQLCIVQILLGAESLSRTMLQTWT